jgi:hypothetical protein
VLQKRADGPVFEELFQDARQLKIRRQSLADALIAQLVPAKPQLTAMAQALTRDETIEDRLHKDGHERRVRRESIHAFSQFAPPPGMCWWFIGPPTSPAVHAIYNECMHVSMCMSAAARPFVTDMAKSITRDDSENFHDRLYKDGLERRERRASVHASALSAPVVAKPHITEMAKSITRDESFEERLLKDAQDRRIRRASVHALSVHAPK